MLLLLYGSIATPVYEELLFRGLIWNRCAGVFRSHLAVGIWNIVLFTPWHLGFILPAIPDGARPAVLWKLAAGAGYGLVCSLARLCRNSSPWGVESVVGLTDAGAAVIS